jgi:hypothetical protein
LTAVIIPLDIVTEAVALTPTLPFAVVGALNDAVGVVIYPDPGLDMTADEIYPKHSTVLIAPPAIDEAYPSAPVPPPPEKLNVGVVAAYPPPLLYIVNDANEPLTNDGVALDPEPPPFEYIGK